MMLKKLDKKSILYLIVIVAVALICIGVVYYLSQKEIEEKSEEPERETLIERQLRELDQLRGEDQSLSGEEIQKQLEELEALR